MNPIHRCLQKILPGNHFSYVRMYVRTDKGDAICPPPPIINGGGIISRGQKHANYPAWEGLIFSTTTDRIKEREYDQEIPQSQTADRPVAS